MKNLTDLLFSEVMNIFAVRKSGVKRIYKNVFESARQTKKPKSYSNFTVEYIGNNRYNISVDSARYDNLKKQQAN